MKLLRYGAKGKEKPGLLDKNGKIREDGRMVHDMYLFQVKSPAESKAPWDYYKHLATIPGDQAFATLADSGCHVTW